MPRPRFIVGLRGLASVTSGLVTGVALLAVLWLTLASAALLWLTGGFHDPHLASWQRPYQWLVHARAFGSDLGDAACVVVAALLASAPFALYVRFRLLCPGGPRLRPSAGSRGITRGTSDNFGHADWMPLPQAAALFPATPDPDVGGVVVGELDRVDLGPVARVPFDPDKRETWGSGGKASLMIDPCKRGTTHSMVIGGGGTYKSTTLVTTLLTWRRSMFVLDPAKELADLVGTELEDRGRKVVRLGIGGVGPNVLAGIDVDSPEAEADVQAVVGRITGPSLDEGKGAEFKEWGRTIVTALLAHMLWEPSIPAELKTLRALRDGLEGGMEVVRNRLRGIAETSHSPLARSLASTMWDMVNETFSGAYGHATRDTRWLASDAYADLVSGDTYRMNELVGGNLAVFCQVPLKALEHTPAVARVLVGCHLDAVLRAEGRVNGRVLFPIDEAVLVRNDPALKIARDQGRKSKITLQLFYQSEGQVEEVWGSGGKKAWYDGLSWRTYAGVQNLDTAREVSAIVGTYGAMAVSSGTNRGKSGRGLEIRSGSRGSSVNAQEMGREVAKPHELLAEMRDDERITLARNRAPIRHGAAIGFRRPEIGMLLGTTSYQQRRPLEAAE